VRPKLTVSIDTNVNSTILSLVDNVRSWRPGDTLVVASTDYSMYQAEEFRVLPCKACTSTQVKVAGRYLLISGCRNLNTGRLQVKDWNL
jgi:cell migration-inducing and hyaluronan-binding protein